MATHQDNNLSFDPDEQLARLRSWCRDSAPAFYADQAQYLRLLRHHLPRAAHTALGELLSGVDPARLNQLSDQGRAELQQRIDQLVQRCSTLLTIEQLQLLARDLSREHHSQRRQLQRAMVESLNQTEESADPTSPQHETGQGGTGSVGGNDSGSVTLSLAPPIDQPDLLEGLLPPRRDPDDESVAALSSEQSNDDPSFGLDVQFEETPSEADQSGVDGGAPQGGNDLDLLRSLFVMAGQAMEAEEEDSGQNAADLDASSSSDSDDASEFMPSMPLELHRWLDGLDEAVKRRLRNLSHAINVELLRAGLASSLLPMSLLDAVLSGQVETLPSPSNLLRLRVPLPIPAHGGEDMIDLSCVLLRTADVEFDLLSLRRCRRRLRQRKRSLLTMVRQQRHWQRRAQTQQVQQQWWQSPPTSPPLT